MLLALTLILFVTAAASDASLDNIKGAWITIVAFPRPTEPYPCEKFEISILNASLPCICDSVPTNLPLLRASSPKSGYLEEYVIDIVETSEQILPALNKNCVCGNLKKHCVARFLNVNSVIHYEKTNQEPIAYLSYKDIPLGSEVRKVIQEAADLKNREPYYICSV